MEIIKSPFFSETDAAILEPDVVGKQELVQVYVSMATTSTPLESRFRTICQLFLPFDVTTCFYWGIWSMTWKSWTTEKTLKEDYQEDATPLTAGFSSILSNCLHNNSSDRCVHAINQLIHFSQRYTADQRACHQAPAAASLIEATIDFLVNFWISSASRTEQLNQSILIYKALFI